MTVFDHFPTFSFRQFKLRAIDPERDAAAYFDLITHPQVSLYIPDGCIPQSVAHSAKDLAFLEQLFALKKSFYWAIADENDQLIGTCGYEIWNTLHRRLELVYELHPNYWRRGIMTEALLYIRHFAFQELKATRIDAYTITDNPASYLLLEKIGFRLDAVLRKYRFYKGKFVDIKLYSSIYSDKVNQLSLQKQLNKIKK